MGKRRSVPGDQAALMDRRVRPCPLCKGYGTRLGVTCRTCGGTGAVTRTAPTEPARHG
jgi:DnaJ-class molecular chaperone